MPCPGLVWRILILHGVACAFAVNVTIGIATGTLRTIHLEYRWVGGREYSVEASNLFVANHLIRPGQPRPRNMMLHDRKAPVGFTQGRISTH